MKISVLFSIGMLIQCYVFTQGISRGPDTGEIYFIGPTATTLYNGIYRSTDFGETVTLMAEEPQPAGDFLSGVVADKKSGVVYFTTSLLEKLYYSEDYGTTGSWIYRTDGINAEILSGVNDGKIFERIVKLSTDFGQNFTSCSINGFFGYHVDPALDWQENTGYALVKKWGVPDTTYLLISYDDFENLEIQNFFIGIYNPYQRITRGGKAGEIFLVIPENPVDVRFSEDFGLTWQESANKDLYIHNPTTINMTGGRTSGELYINVQYIQMTGEIRHVYIYHSIDYGATFEKFHPYAYGPDPYYINFEAEPRTGPFPLTVQFINTSSGAWENWAWDFNGDTIYDSFEMNPVFTFQDTGMYNVILKGIPDNWPLPDSLQKKKYIHVTDTTTSIVTGIKSAIKLFPIPCKNNIFVEFSENCSSAVFSIFRIDGTLVRCCFEKQVQNCPQHYIIDLNDVDDGVYILKIETPNSIIIKKFIKRN